MILAAITTHKRPPEMVERALKSVIAQTYTDWNLVVVDDSPADWELRDDVRKMVEGYAENDSRIRYVAHDRNYGAQRARNTALGIAVKEGFEFIGYLDDDDEWLPEKLEKQLARLQECDEDTALAYCFYYQVNDDKGTVFFNYGWSALAPEGEVFDKLMLGDFVASIFPLIRVKCLDAVGGFDEEMPANQDYEMWLRIAEHYKFVCVPEPLAKLHRYDGEHIWANMNRPIKGHERIISKNRAYFETHKNAYCETLRRLMWMYMKNGEIKQSFKTWFKIMSLQPSKILTSIWWFISMFTVTPFREWLMMEHPKMYYILRNMKHKLKGEKKS